MQTIEIALEEASVEQLVQYLTILGGEAPEKPNKGSVLRLIQAIRPGDAPIRLPEHATFHEPASADADIPPTCLAEVEENGRKRTYVGLRIPESKEPGGKQAVPLSVNGVRFDVPRNQNVWVPIEFYRVLDNARRWEYDEGNSGLKMPREVHDYPFTFQRPKHSPLEQKSLITKLTSEVAA